MTIWNDLVESKFFKIEYNFLGENSVDILQPFAVEFRHSYELKTNSSVETIVPGDRSEGLRL